MKVFYLGMEAMTDVMTDSTTTTMTGEVLAVGAGLPSPVPIQPSSAKATVDSAKMSDRETSSFFIPTA